MESLTEVALAALSVVVHPESHSPRKTCKETLIEGVLQDFISFPAAARIRTLQIKLRNHVEYEKQLYNPLVLGTLDCDTFNQLISTFVMVISLPGV